MTAPSPSPEEVDAACAAARVPGAGISRMDMVAALEAAGEVREGRRRAVAVGVCWFCKGDGYDCDECGWSGLTANRGEAPR